MSRKTLQITRQASIFAEQDGQTFLGSTVVEIQMRLDRWDGLLASG